MFVNDRQAIEHIPPRQPRARVEHMLRKRRRFSYGHALEVDGHRQCGHLVVRHLAAREASDRPADLVVGELTAIPFGRDDLSGVHRSLPVSTISLLSRSVACSTARTTASLVVSEGRSGQHSLLTTDSPSTSMPSPW